MLGHILSQIDLLGIPILLNFSKSKKFRSSFGGFWSLAFLAFVIWAIYNSGSELFDKKKPQVNEGVIYNPKVRPLELSSNTLPVAIAVEGVSGYNIPVQCEYSYAVKLTASSSDYSFNNRLAMEKCTKEHFADFGGIIDDDTQDILNYYYCLPKASNSGSIYGLSLSVSCPSQSGLDAFVSTSPTVELFYPKYGLTLQNYKTPIQPYLFDFEIGLKNKTTYSYWSLSHLNITTDEGWLATSDQTAYYVQVAPQANPSVYDAEGVGVVFEFDIDKQELFYTRTYTKVQNVLAAVGGIAGSVLGILLILITPYTRIKLSEAFVNEMFQVKLEKQQTAQGGKQRRTKSKKSAKEMKSPHRDDKGSFERDEIKKDSLKAIELSKRGSKDTGSPSVIAKEKAKSTEFAKTENDESPCKSPLLGCEDERYVSSNLTWKPKSVSKPLVSVSENEKACLSRPQVGEPLVLQVNTNTPKSVKRSDSDIEEGLKSIQTVRQKEMTDRLETKNPFFEDQNDIIIDLKEEPNSEAHKGLDNLEADSAHPVAKVAVEGDNEVRGEEHIRDRDDIQKDCDRDPNEAELEDANTKLGRGGVLGIVQSALPTKPIKIKRPKTIHISFMEYIKSFFFKSEATKEKLEILNKGLNILDSRLDILNILKKLRDADKIKGLIFDADQQFLFDKLPHPQINNRANHWFQEDYEIFKDSNEVKELGMKAQIRDSIRRIEEKPKKSKVDEKILSLI